MPSLDQQADVVVDLLESFGARDTTLALTCVAALVAVVVAEPAMSHRF